MSYYVHERDGEEGWYLDSMCRPVHVDEYGNATTYYAGRYSHNYAELGKLVRLVLPPPQRDLRLTADNVRAGRASLKPTSRFRLFGVTEGDLDRVEQEMIAVLEAQERGDE